MKRIVLLSLTFLLCLNLTAQEIETTKALQLVAHNLPAAGLTLEDLGNAKVSNAYHDRTSGLDLVYLQQLYKGLPVFNQLQVMAFQQGKLVSNTGGRIAQPEVKSHRASEIASVDPGVAVRSALQAKKLNADFFTSPIVLQQGRKYDFGKPLSFQENITAELMWVPINDGAELVLAWQVYLVPKTSSDYWLIRVHAHQNKVVDENNLTVYCKFHSPAEHQHGSEVKYPGFGKKESATEQPEGARKMFRLSVANNSPSIVNNATYKVIPFPAESPIHPGGTPAVVSNPWNAAAGNATSLKWHSNGTTDYNITRGNNVWAKEDLAASNSTTGVPATSTTAADPLTFNFTPDFNVSPTQTTPVPNQQFNITNLFYWNNIIHDVMYQYGFDEVSGNFQANNQGRGGAGNDFVLADAQDGNYVTPNQNNANFSTPADGGSGRMQMYLWDAHATFTVNAPAVIAGPYTCLESNFSTGNKLANVGPVTGDVVYYNDVSGGLHEGCVTPGNSLTGKIALIQRGNCNFTVKVKNAQDAGAIAVVMVNNVAGNPIIMGGTDNTITIPAVMISDVDGATLIAQLNNGLNVTLRGGPNLDGDVDNGVVVHEYGHGISNRLTGGPAQASCVSSAENMGEGWSDYICLMLTQDWANSNVNTGFNSPRGIGNYVIGFPPNGPGIRTQKYCTNMAVNNLVYANSIPAESHDRGEIWCAVLWDMTWNIIQQTNQIEPSIYNASGNGGNAIALKLVTEAMKLQPCNPGFIDGRNAILKADSILYNAQYDCAIREAFRRRGMGLNASQGTTNSVTDQTADFTPYVTSKLNENVATQLEGQNVTYTTTINSCSPLTNYLITDTLPANVTYVSGGTYNATNRVVSFPVNLPNGGIQTYAFTVQINAGSYYTPTTYLNEAVTNTTIPSSWAASSSTANTWSVSTTQSQSAPNSFFTPDAAVASDQKLETAAGISLGNNQNSLSFYHKYVSQAGFDGGVVEVSTDNGTTWNDLGQKIVSGYYNSKLASGTNNPLALRSAWSGNSSNFVRSTVDLSAYANQNIKLRFRFGSNNSVAGTGWNVDDIVVKNEAVVNIRTNLFNGSAALVNYYDTVTLIQQAPTCTNVTVTSQPANANLCVGSTANFSITADGTTPAYQWQVSTDGGNTWTNISGATTASLSVSNVTLGMNNNRYRVLLSNTCPSNGTSNAAVLTVGEPANISSQPVNQTVCTGETATFSVAASGSSNSYQWQVSTDGGSTWTNISGATTATLTLSNVTSGQHNNRYRVVIQSCGPDALNSNAVVLTVNQAAVINTQPVNTSACTGSNASISVAATGANVTYQWQVSTNGGSTFNDISGANGATLNLSNVGSGMNNNQYHVLISSSCNSLTSANVTLTVSDPASITAQPADQVLCEGGNASFSVTAAGTNVSYQWQVSTDGGSTWTDVSGATSATLNLSAVTASMNNNRYRVVLVSCSPAGLNSTAVTLTVNALAAISAQPVNASVCAGSNASFAVTASGTGNSYQWQVSTDGGSTFSNIPGANGSTLSVNAATLSQNGSIYHVLISNSCSSNITSANATLTVSSVASVTTQPNNTTVCAGSNASFTAVAAGTGFQWQVSTDGGTIYSDISGATNQTLTLSNVTASQSGYLYHLVASGCSANPAVSNAASLTVNTAASITAQPVNATSCAGNNASFSVSVTGSSPSYQWQVSTDGGATFSNISGATGSTLSLTGVTTGMNNNIYQVIVSNVCTSSLTSATAQLAVTNQASISSQPADQSACPGTNASFSVTASGPGLGYQWQVSTDGGISWTDISGATSAVLNVNGVTTAQNNFRYRAQISSSCSAAATASNAAVLTVLNAASVTLQPADVDGCIGANVSFAVTATGNNLTYQWQVSTNGGNTWANISGATNSTLTLNNIDAGLNNNQYRVLINANPCGTVSNTANLSVRPSPTVTVTASPYTQLYPGLTTTLTATSVPAGSNYNWFKDGSLLPNVHGNTLTIGYDDRGSYTASDTDGCANLSNALAITDSITSLVFIYPNPNDGIFNVRYYSITSIAQVRNIGVYDAKGARVYSRNYTVNTAYQDMQVDIRHLASGIYMVAVYDASGNRLATGKVLKQ